MSTPSLAALDVSDRLGVDSVPGGEDAGGLTAAANVSGRFFRQLCAHAAADVLGSRDWLKVGGVDAAPNAAEMIYLKPLRNGADELFVRDNMRDDHTSAHTDPPVLRIGRVTPDPDPARAGVTAVFHDVVTRSDPASPFPGGKAASITEPRPARARRSSASLALQYLGNRVTSLGEVAPWGWRKGFRWPQFYLAMNPKEVH